MLCSLQELLRLCAEHPEAKDKEKAAKEAEAEAESSANRRAGAGAGAGAATSTKGGKASGPGGAGEEDKKEGSDVAGKYLHQSAAVLGLALVSMGEELSVDSEWIASANRYFYWHVQRLV